MYNASEEMAKDLNRIIKRSNRTIMIDIIVLVAVILVLVCTVGIKPINKVINERTVTVTVTDKTVKNNKSDGKYLIYTTTEDDEPLVLEITDSILKWRFDSSDVYAQIKVGNTYKFTVCGNRIHILSVYPNIYEVKEIDSWESTLVN